MEKPVAVTIQEAEKNIDDMEKLLTTKIKIKSLPKEELDVIAMDMATDKIFSNFHIRKEDMDLLPSIFMLLFLGAFEGFDEDNEFPTMIYEYLSEAGPRAINGYPIFFSMKCLGLEDSEYVMERCNKIVETLKNIS